jgi:hypothetical protein
MAGVEQAFLDESTIRALQAQPQPTAVVAERGPSRLRLRRGQRCQSGGHLLRARAIGLALDGQRERGQKEQPHDGEHCWTLTSVEGRRCARTATRSPI